MDGDKIIFKTELRKLSDLVPTSYNPRSLSEKEYKKLKSSLEYFGLTELPIINKNGDLLVGHQRTKILAALEGKDIEIEVRVPNRKLTKKEADRLLIESNKINGQWDMDILANEWDIDFLLENELFEDWELGLDGGFKVDDDFDIKPKEEKAPKLTVKLDYTDEPDGTFLDKLDEFLKQFPDVKKK